MAASERLVEKAQEYEQRAAHQAEVAEIPGSSVAHDLSAVGFTIVAIVLREVAVVLEEELAA